MIDGVTERDAQYAFSIVDRICKEVGPGLPGSAQERQRAAIIEKELAGHLGAERVAVEEFLMAPFPFVGSVQLGALLTLAAGLLCLSAGRLGLPPRGTAAAALACSTLAVAIVTLEFLFSFELIDRWCPRRPSQNVIGTLRSSDREPVERLLIVSGHHDSAPENTWLRLLGYGGLIGSTIMFLGFVTMLALCVGQLVGMRLGTAGAILLAFPVLPSIVVGLSFTRGRKGGGNVPGAVDNLAASALAVALCRYLCRHPGCLPPRTEVRFISFGSEEAGVRGSRRYVERHHDELRRLDARVLNIEMVADPLITIFTSDLNRRVKHSPEMVRSVVAAAAAAGVPHRVRPAGLGVGTDAGPFSLAGFKAVTLFPFKAPQQLVAFYHQKWDRPEVLTLPPLENVLKLALEWVRRGGA